VSALASGDGAGAAAGRSGVMSEVKRDVMTVLRRNLQPLQAILRG
jgi:hypothetical protein